MRRGVTRRRFLGHVAGAVGAAAVGPYILRAQDVSRRLNIAFVGTGGKGESHLGLAKSENCIAYCDVDKSRWAKAAAVAPNAQGYTDWRRMLDRHEKELDAIVVATPDHSHAGPTLRAIRAGKHVYTEKPLTWSIQEARLLAEATAKHKVATQMGNQGHANEGNRLVVEWVRAGAIGQVLEVHTWTNRPVWPQGIAQRPPSEPVPQNLDWESWIGPAPFREYHAGLHPFKWRGWFDFGCGAVGDMGCHTWDGPYWAMDPDYPTAVELLEIRNKTDETFPSQSHFKWEFPAKGRRPAFVAHWYSGGLKPPTPEEMLNDPKRQGKDGKKPTLPASGSLYIGTKGKLLVEGDYGNSPRLIPESFMQEYQRPEKTIPRSPGHKQEWLMACRGEKPWDYPGSNFATYAGPITEVMLLGAICERIGQVGFRIECDPVKRVVKTREALAYVSRENRKGWEL
mgnify:CR=1 FL=1